MSAIVRVPHAILATAAKPVTTFDRRLKRLVGALKETLAVTKNPKGVGLAAPQIGQPYRVFVTKPTESSMMRVFVNPAIVRESRELTDGVPERENKLEGCLSIPHVWGKVKRSQSVTLHYQDEQGANHTETYRGFLATIIQHEMDHLNGILFTQRVLEQKGTVYQHAKDGEGKDILEEIQI